LSGFGLNLTSDITGGVLFEMCVTTRAQVYSQKFHCHSRKEKPPFSDNQHYAALDWSLSIGWASIDKLVCGGTKVPSLRIDTSTARRSSQPAFAVLLLLLTMNALNICLMVLVAYIVSLSTEKQYG
jgi:hypothetical protein